jgi:hypothetical protein
VLAFPLLLPSAAVRADSPNYLIQTERWNEDYSYLANPDFRPQGLERLKFIAFDDNRDFWLSLGGEMRVRVDSVTNSQFGLHPRHDYLARYTRWLLNGDLHYGSHVRLFVQLGYWTGAGRKPAAKTYDRSDVDVAQAFVDVSDLHWRLRAGRQELPLGDERLADTRESQNIRRAFDAVRLDIRFSPVHLTAFYGSPILNKPGSFDDRATKNEIFTGVYATSMFDSASGLDLFALVRNKPNATFTEGTAHEHRASFGGRFFGATHGWDYNFQGLVQTGRFGNEAILAYGASADMGRSFRLLTWHARLGARFDLASGDTVKGDGKLQSFDAPYPNFSYLSATGAYWPGNAWSVFPMLELEPDNATTMYVGTEYVGRLSLGDGFYWQPEAPIALNNSARGLMDQVYARVRWQPSQHWYLSGVALYQIPGNATRNAGGHNALIVSASAGAKF